MSNGPKSYKTPDCMSGVFLCIMILCAIRHYCGVQKSITDIFRQHTPFSALQFKNREALTASLMDSFTRSIFILPTSQNRHSSLPETILANIIIECSYEYVNKRVI